MVSGKYILYRLATMKGIGLDFVPFYNAQDCWILLTDDLYRSIQRIQCLKIFKEHSNRV